MRTDGINEKRRLLVLFLGLLLLLAGSMFALQPDAYADEELSAQADSGIVIYRLYNDRSGEHLYTANRNEACYLANNHATLRWNYEGVGWVAPTSGEAVYRVYNRATGEHLYTKSAYERDVLVKSVWNYEGIAYYSKSGSSSVKTYRLYNPNGPQVAQHHYTTSWAEAQFCKSKGWRYEGVAFDVQTEGAAVTSTLGLKKVEAAGHYEPVYTKKWVPNIVTVVDRPESTGYAQIGRIFTFSDGTVMYVHVPYISGELDAVDNYLDKHPTIGMTEKPDWKTVTTPAITHTEDKGHYEQVQTGTKYVSDGAAHWE